MAPLKIAVLGAGSFVFGPSVLSQAILENELGEFELALMDPDAETLDLMGGLGRRMAFEAHKPAHISTHIRRETALDGADYVICAVAVQGRRRYEIDSQIIAQHSPGHLLTEFGGIAGISYSLRQIAMITAVTDDIKRLCPGAWLLNVANPLPRVCQAAHENGVMTIGFCSVGLAAHNALWQLLRNGPPLTYPFTEAIKHWHMTTAGVNHFTWVLELSDRHSGENLLPQIVQLIREGRSSGNPQIEALCLETGFYLAAGDNHVRDFLTPARPAPPAHVPFHGDDQERWDRMKRLREVVFDDADWEPVLESVSWERPLDLIAARAGGKRMNFRALNLVNSDQMPDLPAGVFVETPCTVDASGVQPETLRLPESVQALTRRAAQVTEGIVRAAQARSRAALYDVIELDPTIEDKAAGRKALDACLIAHAHLLPVYD